MTRLTWGLAVALTCIATTASAVDTLTRRSDGKKVSGTITEISKTEVNVKKAVGEPEVVAANDVAAVEWGDGGPDLRLGYTDEASGKYESALTRYNKAKTEAKNPSDFLKTEFEYVIARATARAALADPTKLDAAAKQLQAIQKAKPDYFRYYESLDMLGQVQLAQGDFAAARATYDLIAKSPWNDYKLLAKIASGRISVAENKLDDAAREFSEAAAAATDTPADQARKYEAMLGQARAQIAQAKFEDALTTLETVTDKGPADDSGIQAEAYVLQGNALQSLGRMKEAALAYLHVDILFARESQLHAEALYNLSKTWKQVQLPDRSADAEAKLAQLYPNSAWRKKLASGN